jgi:SAM-dependent methyltransferase
MPTSAAELVAANREHRISEIDSFTPRRYAQFHSHFPEKTRTVLDVGCNTGRGGAVLKQRDPALKVIGLDCVPERISALDPAVYHDGVCGFTTAIPLADGRVVVICAGEFIEHVPPGQVDATLAEFFRVLRLRGRLLLTTPNPNYLKNKLKGLSVLNDAHVSQHYPDCLAFRLRCVGFSNVRTLGSGRVSSYVGQRFPWLSIYGSYLVRADKW